MSQNSLEEKIANELKLFMRLVAQPVTVVTTKHEGKLAGITVSSFTSISLHEPLVLVSISKGAPSLSALLDGKAFVVNLLNKGQEFLADRFAGLHNVEDKFKDMNIGYNKRGLPFLSDCAAHLDCNLWQSYPTGDHMTILGTPVDIVVKKSSEPLVYFARQYCHVINKSVLVFPEDYAVG